MAFAPVNGLTSQVWGRGMALTLRDPSLFTRTIYKPYHEKTCLCHMRTTKAQKAQHGWFIYESSTWNTHFMKAQHGWLIYESPTWNAHLWKPDMECSFMKAQQWMLIYGSLTWNGHLWKPNLECWFMKGRHGMLIYKSQSWNTWCRNSQSLRMELTLVRWHLDTNTYMVQKCLCILLSRAHVAEITRNDWCITSWIFSDLGYSLCLLNLRINLNKILRLRKKYKKLKKYRPCFLDWIWTACIQL